MEEKEFERLLNVCRIRLSNEEKNKMKHDITDIISYFDSIESIKCEDLPAYQPIDLPEQLREDGIKEFNDIDLILKGTKTYRFYVVGPKI